MRIARALSSPLRRIRRRSSSSIRSFAMAPKGSAAAQEFIDTTNAKYMELHKGFEDNFWATKMNLAGNSTEELVRTKGLYDNFLADKANLARTRELKHDKEVTPEQMDVLDIFERTFLCYMMESTEAEALRDKSTELEGVLEAGRRNMKLGYTDPKTGKFEAASSVLLRTKMRTAEDEATRKACYEGMRSIGPAVVDQFVEIIKCRNRMAKALGYADFYEYKVQAAEGFDKATLFGMLDGLEERTRPIMKSARAEVAKRFGDAALEPWNMGQALSGETETEQDPYFPFEDAVSAWGRTFAGLGITYEKSEMRLDLCDRDMKYSNGFCHWPEPAWVDSSGTLHPAKTNFTSLATPNAVGSGKTALATLLHEAGHASHFANVLQPSPFFSQERAPMSVAYAENQSMFLDSLVGDASWISRFALTREGKNIPWEILEKGIRAKHPFEVFQVRAMLAVPYFEKALYEADESEITSEFVLALADKIDTEIQGGLSGRPLMCVPHILSDESSCYYHGYVLAEMSVHQTREHFLGKYGKIVDEPRVGADLISYYWRPGNKERFLDLVEKLTGKALTADAWVNALNEDLEELVVKEKADYEEGIKTGPKFPPGADIDLDMRVLAVDGDDVIADTEADGGFTAMTDKYKTWIREKYFAPAATAAA